MAYDDEVRTKPVSKAEYMRKNWDNSFRNALHMIRTGQGYDISQDERDALDTILAASTDGPQGLTDEQIELAYDIAKRVGRTAGNDYEAYASTYDNTGNARPESTPSASSSPSVSAPVKRNTPNLVDTPDYIPEEPIDLSIPDFAPGSAPKVQPMMPRTVKPTTTPAPVATPAPTVTPAPQQNTSGVVATPRNSAMNTISNNVFGPKPAEPTESERLAAIREQRFSDWINSRKKEIEQQRTDAIKMARFNALGNVLTTMVQPLGWTAGGVTGGVQPYDDRQYLDAFNRAVKASDDLRNIGNVEAEYQFKLADNAYNEAKALENYEKRKDIEYGYKSEYAKQRQLEELEKITLRGEYKLSEAELRGKYKITKNGREISGDELKTAKTQYAHYLEKYRTDVGRGVQRTEPNGMPLSFGAWLGSDAGGNYNVTPNDGTAATTPATPATPAAPATTSTSTSTPAQSSATSTSASKTPPSRQKASGNNNANNSKTPPSKRNK